MCQPSGPPHRFQITKREELVPRGAGKYSRRVTKTNPIQQWTRPVAQRLLHGASVHWYPHLKWAVDLMPGFSHVMPTRYGCEFRLPMDGPVHTPFSDENFMFLLLTVIYCVLVDRILRLIYVTPVNGPKLDVVLHS